MHQNRHLLMNVIVRCIVCKQYVLVFPQLFAMLQELESSNIRGCRLLDHFHNFNTGIPVLKEVISR